MNNYKAFFGVAALFCLVAGLLGYLVRIAGPVLYSYRDRANASQGPGFILLNPFRDRSPELVAEQLLRLFKEGKCSSALAYTAIQDDKRSMLCERESQATLEAWTLKNRSESDGVVALHYGLMRDGFEGFGGEGFFKVQKVPGGWTVTDISFVY